MTMSGNDFWNRQKCLQPLSRRQKRWRRLEMNRQRILDNACCNRKRATADGYQTVWRNEHMKCRRRPQTATTIDRSDTVTHCTVYILSNRCFSRTTPRKMWMDVVRRDLKDMDITRGETEEHWQQIEQDGDSTCGPCRHLDAE